MARAMFSFLASSSAVTCGARDDDDDEEVLSRAKAGVIDIIVGSPPAGESTGAESGFGL